MTGPSSDWTEVAQSWDIHRNEIEDISRPLTDEFLQRLGLQPGERVLELAGGNGEFASRIIDLVTPGGSLLASDVAEGMVDLIERRLSGTPHVEARRIDACHIDCTSGIFDVVVMRMGLMLIPDPAPALAEIRRVTRPGGRFGAAVWGAAQQNLWMASVAMAAVQGGFLGFPPPGAPGPFALQDPAALEELVRGAGFDDAEVTTVGWTRRFPSADAHLTRCGRSPRRSRRRTPGPPTSRSPPPARRSPVLRSNSVTADALVMPAEALVVIAR